MTLPDYRRWVAMRNTPRQSRGLGDVKRAFSMLETTIAVAILGVGLIMVAAVFPVALSQHQTNAEQAAALELITKAAAFLHASIDTTQLYVPPTVPPGTDSPWYLLPTVNVASNAAVWDPMFQGANIYANLVSDMDRIYGPQPAIRTGNFPDYLGAGPWSANRQKFFSGLDVLSDRLGARPIDSFSPFTDAELQEAPNRFAWYGFYRRLATGDVKYAVAVCKQRRNELFSEQDMTGSTPGFTPFAAPRGVQPPSRRLPLPWRISVGYRGGRQLSNSPVNPLIAQNIVGLGFIAPTGTKLMIQGMVTTNPLFATSVPVGRILTVANVIDVFTVDVFEDISDLPSLDFSTGNGAAFDVWLLPPAVDPSGVGGLGRNYPCLAWRANL